MTDATPNATTTDRIKDGLDGARDRASHAYDSARGRASDAARQTAETIDTNPVGVLVGGLALGALVAAVIPRSDREKKLLAPVGRSVGLAATAAFAAAKEAGKSELDSRGLTPSAAKGQVRSLFGDVMKAATSAGSAAVKAGSDQVRNR